MSSKSKPILNSQFINVDSKKSLNISESQSFKNIDKEIFNLVSEFNKESKRLSEIRESGDNDELIITNSQIIAIECNEADEIKLNKNSPFKKDTPLKLDSVDLEQFFKSQIKNITPKNKNFKFRGNNLSEKKLEDFKNSEYDKNNPSDCREKFLINLSQNLEIKEEDLMMILEGICTQKKFDPSPINMANRNKENLKVNLLTIKKECNINLVGRVNESKYVQSHETDMNYFNGKNCSNCNCHNLMNNNNNINSNFNSSIRVDNQNLNSPLDEFKKYFTLLFDYFKEKCLELEYLKCDIKKLNGKLLNLENFSSIKNSNGNKGIFIKENIYEEQIENPLEDVERRPQNLFQNSFQRANLYTNKDAMGNNNTYTKRNGNVNGDENRNINEGLQNKSNSCDISYDVMFNEKFEYGDIKEDEFDTILKDMENKKYKPNTMNFDFVPVNNLSNENAKIKSTSNYLKNNNKEDNLDEVIVVKNKNDLMKNIKDDEFDNLLKNYKNIKSDTGPIINVNKRNEFKAYKNFVNPSFNKNINSISKKENVINEEEIVESDFISGNNRATFKPNKKIKNMIEDMEKYEEDDQNEKIIEEDKMKQKAKQEKKEIQKSKEITNQSSNSKNKNLLNNHISNKSNMNKQNSNSKLLKVNQWSSEKLNSKRLFSDHVKSMIPESKKNINTIENTINKKLKSNNHFKIIENKKELVSNQSNKKFETKSDGRNLRRESRKKLAENKLNNQFYICDIIDCEFICECIDDKSCESCTNCNDLLIINKSNFSNIFKSYYLSLRNDSNFKLQKNQEEFLSYQYRVVTWKYYFLSKVYDDKSIFSLKNILKNVMGKFDLIFDKSKRSFLTKVSEKDSSINKNMILLILDIKNFGDNFIIELSDGYKSVFSEINKENPIFNLIIKNIIISGIKLNIGLAKVDRIDDDFKVFIKIFYNSISKASFSSKLGVHLENKFLLKNIANLREDGGEVSLIDIVVLKKYEYYCFDFSKKLKFSSDKFEKLMEKYSENLVKSDDNNKESTNNKINSPPSENILYNLKLICADSLLYLNYINEIGGPATKLSNFNLKKSIKTKLMKKCIIEIQFKNFNFLENFSEGNRYQLGLLNISKNSKKFYNDNKNLKLKANDSILIKEIKINKKESSHNKILIELGKITNTNIEDIEINEYLSNTNLDWSKLAFDEVSLVGVYLNRYSYIKNNYLIPTIEGKEISSIENLYLYFLNKNNNFIIIKIHDENFYDVTKFLNPKRNNYMIYNFKNINFQSVLYFDYLNTKKLIPFKSEKMNEQIYDNKFAVIYMETTINSTFKIVNSSTKYHKDFNKFIKNKLNENKESIYDEVILNEIINSITIK